MEVVGGLSYGFVGLYMKDTLADESFTISGDWLALRAAVSRVSKGPRCQSIRNKDKQKRNNTEKKTTFINFIVTKF